jgi:hypothetical protein
LTFMRNVVLRVEDLSEICPGRGQRIVRDIHGLSGRNSRKSCNPCSVGGGVDVRWDSVKG